LQRKDRLDTEICIFAKKLQNFTTEKVQSPLSSFSVFEMVGDFCSLPADMDPLKFTTATLLLPNGRKVEKGSLENRSQSYDPELQRCKNLQHNKKPGAYDRELQRLCCQNLQLH
jgi:hypothetical protein